MLADDELDERPVQQADFLLTKASQRQVLTRNGINPEAGSTGNETMLDSICRQLSQPVGDHRLHAKIVCICLVLHTLIRADSMRSYEALVQFLRLLGWLPQDRGLGGDDSGWKVARAADKVRPFQLMMANSMG